MRRFAALALALLVVGCASVSPDAGLSDVHKMTSERLGGGAPADAAVARLLESPLTAESALQIALVNNRRLQAEYHALGIAEAELVQAGLLDNPELSAEALFGGDGTKLAFGLVQNVIGLLTQPARRTVATSAFERAKYQTAQKVLDLAAEVRAAYYGVVAAEQSAELLRQVVSATEAAAELSQRQVLAGNATPRDQALQQAQYARAVLDLSRAEIDIASGRERLNRLLGLWGDQLAWNLPDRLPDVPDAAVELDGLESLAITRRLDLAGARADVQTAGYALDLAQQLRWLSVLGLGVSLEREDGKWLKGPQVHLSLPLFDQGQARIATLEAEQRRSDQLYVALAVEVRADARDAWTRLVAARRAAAFYRTTILPLQQRIVEENTVLHNSMQLGIFELLRSRQEQIEAARGYIAALKDYWLARADLEKAIAGPLPH